MRHTRIMVTHYGGPDALRVVEEECPEPRVPFTPGWDLVGVVDIIGAGVSGIEPGQIVAAMPISGAYAEFVCLPPGELVPVQSGLDAAEAVCLYSSWRL